MATQTDSKDRKFQLILSLHDVDADDSTNASGAFGNNRPEKRKRLIYEALTATYGDALTVHRIDSPTPLTTDTTAGVHAETMLQLFDSGWERFEEMKTATPELVELEDWLEPCAPLSRPPAKLTGMPSDSKEADTETFVLVPAQIATHNGIHRPSKCILSQLSYHGQDRFTPLSPFTSSMVQHDLSVTHAAVDALTSGEATDVYALVTSAGHHACADSFGGYCYVNQGCVAAKLLNKTFDKVALVDVDYHCGNGSMSILWNDPAVFFASIHSDPEVEYPFTAGFADQTGGPDAEGLTMCRPLEARAEWKRYKPVLEEVLSAVEAYGAKAIVVSLGLDPLFDDPECRATMQLHPEDYADMGMMFRNTGLPVLMVQEGGYSLESMPAAAVAMVGLESKTA